MHRMRFWVLLCLGTVICASALVFWIYLNGLASAFSNSSRSVDWTSGEAAQMFWLPFVAGGALIAAAWRFRKR